jgi:hypothetical protein
MTSSSRSPGRDRFYKYMKADIVKKVLNGRTLQWSSPTLFNDPFDMQFDLHVEYDGDRVVSRVLQRLVDVYMGRAQPAAGSAFDDNAKLLRTLLPRLTEADIRSEHRPMICEFLTAFERGLPKLHEELRMLLAPRKILCLSEMPDNILMWAHYAENHAGAVIEFSCIPKYASAWEAAKPVRYQATMPLLADEDALVQSLISQKKIATNDHFQNSVYVKAKDWAYEREWRVLGGWENGKKTELIAFRPQELTAVYLGCNMIAADRDEIKKIVVANYSHAKIYIGSKSEKRFSLQFKLAE